MPAFGRPREPDQLRKDFEEFDWSKSDRVCAIVGIALVEEWLEYAIANRMLPDTNSIRGFFSPGGGLESLSAKSTLGYLMGIYGEDTHRTLKALGSIRNKFAHLGFVRDFSHPDLQSIFSSLRLYERLHPIYKSQDSHSLLVKKFLPTHEKPPGRPDQRQKFTWTIKLILAYLMADYLCIEDVKVDTSF
jgi:hypothetical protein